MLSGPKTIHILYLTVLNVNVFNNATIRNNLLRQSVRNASIIRNDDNVLERRTDLNIWARSLLEDVMYRKNHRCLVQSARKGNVNVFVNVIAPKNSSYRLIVRNFRNACEKIEQLKRSPQSSIHDSNFTTIVIDDPRSIEDLFTSIVRKSLQRWFPGIYTYHWHTNLVENYNQTSVAPIDSCKSKDHINHSVKTVLLNVFVDDNRTVLADETEKADYCTDPLLRDSIVRGSLDRLVIPERSNNMTAPCTHLSRSIASHPFDFKTTCRKTQWLEWNVTVRAFVRGKVPFTYHEIDEEGHCILNDVQRNLLLQRIKCRYGSSKSRPFSCAILNPSHNVRSYIIGRLAEELGFSCIKINEWRNVYSIANESSVAQSTGEN